MSWRTEELLWLFTAVPVVAGLFVLAWWLRKRATQRFGEESIVRAMRRSGLR